MSGRSISGVLGNAGDLRGLGAEEGLRWSFVPRAGPSVRSWTFGLVDASETIVMEVEPLVVLSKRNAEPGELAGRPPAAVGLGERADRWGHRRYQTLPPPRHHRLVRHLHQRSHVKLRGMVMACWHGHFLTTWPFLRTGLPAVTRQTGPGSRAGSSIEILPCRLKPTPPLPSQPLATGGDDPWDAPRNRRRWPVHAARPVSGQLAEPGDVGEQPHDAEPHLGALEPWCSGGQPPRGRAVRLETESFPVPPVPDRVIHVVAGPPWVAMPWQGFEEGDGLLGGATGGRRDGVRNANASIASGSMCRSSPGAGPAPGPARAEELGLT